MFQVYDASRPLTDSRRSATPTVYAGDTVTVNFDFETPLKFGLSIEQCWLTSQPSGKSANDHWLVADGCPSPSATMVSSSRFQFVVTQQHLAMRRIYVFCVVGICKTEGKVTDKLGKVSYYMHTSGRQLFRAHVSTNITRRQAYATRCFGKHMA